MTARRFISLLLAVIVVMCGTGLFGHAGNAGKALPPGATQIHGAGATFPAPLYKKWLEEYQKRRPEVLLSYDVIGSGEGIKQFMVGAVDFGASDAAMSDQQIAEVARGVQLIPAVAGSLVLAYNLDGLGEGVAGRIKMSKGSIGYVEYGMARRTGLSMAWLENKAGQLIEPHGGSGLATLLNTPLPDNLRVFFPDPDGPDSYPIVTYSWLMLYKRYDDAQKLAALKQFVRWCLGAGQEYNEALGFVRLPPAVVARSLEAVESIR